MKKISVFGGNGFIGSEFCRQTKKPFILLGREERAPISEESLYFISTTHNYHIFEDIQKDVDVNLRILLETLDNLRKGNHTFNFISSWFVYGETKLPAHETNECHPKGFYSITKRTAEQLLISFCETYGLNYRILRLSNVYGPGDAGVSKKKNALQYLIHQLKNNGPIDLYNGGDFYRDYLHVSDVARAIDLCLDKAPTNCIINIGSGERILFKDIFFMAKEFIGSKSKINFVDPPHFHNVVQVKDFYMDSSKIKNMGFVPKISIEEGIKQLCL